MVGIDVDRDSHTVGTTANVLSLAEEFAMRYLPSDAMRQLISRAFGGFRAAAAEMDSECGGAPFVHLPLSVHEAITGDPEPAVPLAIATSLLYLGLDIFDDLADGDLPARWHPCPPAEINLAAATLLSALPQLAIECLPAPAETRCAMQRELAQGLLIMSGGQQQDLSAAGAHQVTSAEVEESVSRKSGGELATFVALAARLAGASERRVGLFRDMGRALGTAGQLSSDCYDLFVAPRSRDLSNGTRTLPIAIFLESQKGDARSRFVHNLREAELIQEAADEIRRALRDAGVLRRCAFVIEVYCCRARRLLDQARPHEAARRKLSEMIDKMSLYGTRTIAERKETEHEPRSNRDVDGSMDERACIPSRAARRPGGGS